MKTITFSLRMPKEIDDKLEEIGIKEERTKASLIRLILKKYLKEIKNAN